LRMQFRELTDSYQSQAVIGMGLVVFAG